MSPTGPIHLTDRRHRSYGRPGPGRRHARRPVRQRGS
jgi:hypothetical protein